MFDHVTIRVSDLAASERFYTTVLEVLGRPPQRGEALPEWEDFSIAQADEGHPVTRRLHVGFYAPTHELVDAFWRAGVDAGYRSDGEPGPRPQYSPAYYGGFLLDPDGNSIEAAFHGTARETGAVDHLWIRVADLDAAARFYDTIAPHAGLTRGHVSAERVQYRAAGCTFSLLPDPAARTEPVHIAFPGTREQVHAFHAAALDAGYRDNGAPGERPQYHPGYYAAFVIDPDGHNVEIVDHGR